MKKVAVLSACAGVLLLVSAVLLFMQAQRGGGLIFLDNGIAFEPRDLAFAVQMVVVMLMVLLAAAWIDAKRATHWFRFAPLAVLLVPLVFPLRFEARLWSEASFPDGKPMFNEGSNERVKSWDAFFGFAPFWAEQFSARPPYDRYETTDLGKRATSSGNWLFGHWQEYGLNQAGWLDFSHIGDAQVYECVFREAREVLGFYWRDDRGEELEYWTQDRLPKDRCNLINRPAIGSELH